MPMSSGGRVASSSGCATKPKAREIGWTGYAGLTQHSLRIGHYVMATAEHREPCDSSGSCTVLGAPGGEIPPGDSAKARHDHGSRSLFRAILYSFQIPFAYRRRSNMRQRGAPPSHQVSACATTIAASVI